MILQAADKSAFYQLTDTATKLQHLHNQAASAIPGRNFPRVPAKHVDVMSPTRPLHNGDQSFLSL